MRFPVLFLTLAWAQLAVARSHAQRPSAASQFDFLVGEWSLDVTSQAVNTPPRYRGDSTAPPVTVSAALAGRFIFGISSVPTLPGFRGSSHASISRVLVRHDPRGTSEAAMRRNRLCEASVSFSTVRNHGSPGRVGHTSLAIPRVHDETRP